MVSEQEILKAKILIVDDQKLQALFLENILKEAGYKNIHTTINLRETIKIFQNFRPDVLLLDITTPAVDGFRIVQQIREMQKDSYFPILALSSEKGQEVRLRALGAGATDI